MQKHAFKGFIFNGPAFEIGRINPYDLKKHCFGRDNVITQAIT